MHNEYPDVSLTIIGEGDGLDMYRALAKREGTAADHIEFVGRVERDEITQYYKLATVFAMPSTSRTEGFGMVYMEANAVGIPVIGSRIGGVPYAVKDHETGLLVEPGSADELESALRTLLDDTARALRLGEAGSARAHAEFDWNVLAEQISDIFEEVSRQGMV